MEQKKILWILIATSGFIVLILGFALIRFTPSPSKGPRLQQALAVTPASVGKSIPNISTSQKDSSSVDPDEWVRNPENTPQFDSLIVPSSGNINLTIVNGNDASARYGTIDVSGLTKTDSPTQSSSLNQNIEIPGKTETTIQASTYLSQTTKAESVVAKKTETIPAKKTEPSVISKSTPPVKKETPKAKTVTEYWIQTGSFTSKLNAEKARATLIERALTAEIFTKDVSNITTYRVRVGPYASKTEATYWLGTIKETPTLAASYISEVKTKK